MQSQEQLKRPFKKKSEFDLMGNVIYIEDKAEWYEASLAKKELAFHRARNNKGLFNEAIKKEEELIRSFRMKAVQAA